MTEDIKTQDLEKRLAELKPEQIEVTDDGDKKEEEEVDLTERYVEPHNKVSRLVTDSDLKHVMEEAHIMFNLLHTEYGLCKGGFALAHQQIDKDEPLRFFVTADKEIIINPVITRHTRHTVDSQEMCLSFPNQPPKIVQRYNKCEGEYYTLVGSGDLSEKREISLSGLDAKIWQHETDHMECEYIWTDKEIKKLEEDDVQASITNSV